MPASIYRSLEGQAEILQLYDEALSRLKIGNESKSVPTRYGETHVLSLGPEDAPPVLFPPWRQLPQPQLSAVVLTHRPATPRPLTGHRWTAGQE